MVCSSLDPRLYLAPNLPKSPSIQKPKEKKNSKKERKKFKRKANAYTSWESNPSSLT
jgi:hypothetical protein